MFDLGGGVLTVEKKGFGGGGKTLASLSLFSSLFLSLSSSPPPYPPFPSPPSPTCPAPILKSYGAPLFRLESNTLPLGVIAT